MTTPHSLLLVGCGKMGSALLERWKHSQAMQRFDIIDPSHIQKNEPNIFWHKNSETLAANYAPDVIILAVKPQQLESILPAYKLRFAGSTPLYISIAAGKTLGFYSHHLGEHVHVVRAMPNTPALVGQGITVLCAAPTLPASAKKIAGDLLKAVGSVEWLEDELLMDAVTSISGCGPAYVFLFIEGLIKAGMAAGLDEHLAKSLALQTVSGSLELAKHSPKSMEQLRIDVASPGGATEAALGVFMQENRLHQVIKEAVLAAKKRSKELS